MATTASGVTIPGPSPTTTAATPIQDHWNNLGKSLNGRIVVPVASVTARAALVAALTAEGYTISASHPLYTHRADATVGTELEVTVNGTSWRTVTSTDSWTDYTPTWTNLTVGNGSLVARHTQVGKTVHAMIDLTLGSTTEISGSVYVSLPVTPASTYPATNVLLGSVGFYDADPSAWRVGGAFRSGATVRLIAADGTSLSATTPFALGDGGIISVNLAYEAA